MNGFLTLDEVVFTPPLPAISSLLLTAGFAGWGEWGLRRAGAARDPVRLGAAFVTAVGIAGAVVHGLAMAHLASIAVLRVIAVLVAAQAWRVWGMVRRFRCDWLIGITIGLVALAALGPVTDPDSLDYHLGVPLDWLRHGGIVAEPHWLHARITGLGEAVNMLGLAAGTDGLGALLQVAGVVVLVSALGSLGATARDRMFGAMLALTPAVLPLTTAQKPLLLPVAATVAALILARDAASAADFALVFACAGFAMASKYSLLVSGAAVGLAAIWWAPKKAAALGWAAMAAAVFVLPVWARNYWLYGDPLSPFLEPMRRAPDAEVVRFAAYLRDAGEPHTAAGVGRFLLELVAPHGWGDLQTVLGVGVFSVLLARATRWTRAAACAGMAVVLFTIWRGQMAPRYLLEPYYWCAAMAVMAPWSRLKSVLFYGMAAQTAAVAAMAAAGAALLFPGALTAGLREQVMSRSTFGYEEARWMDRVIPKEETIMAESRVYALFPRPFVIPECFACGPAPLLDLVRPVDVTGRHAGVLVLNYPPQGRIADGCALQIIAGPERFRYTTRNPFNRAERWLVAMREECR